MDGQEIRIEYRRDSVCAADDYVNHAIEIVLPKGAVLKDLVNYIHHYSEWNDYCSIPYTGGGSWWALKCDKGILALVSDDQQEVKYRSFSAETPLKNLDIKAVYGTRNFEMNTQSETNKQPKKNLLLQAFIKFFLGVVILGLLIFLPAWSLHYWQGWLLMGILFVPMFIAGLVMMVKNPDLLQKRLNAKEQEKEQKTVVALSGLLFIAAFVVAGLNWRFQWCVLPNWVVWVAAGVFLACYLLYAEVLRENTYLSRIIEVQEHQKVIDTGLYGIVRHPMYMATTLLFLTIPLVLASPISFGIMLLYIPLIAKRIRNEEKVLEQGLEGYSEYKQRVKYRILPFIW